VIGCRAGSGAGVGGAGVGGAGVGGAGVRGAGCPAFRGLLPGLVPLPGGRIRAFPEGFAVPGGRLAASRGAVRRKMKGFRGPGGDLPLPEGFSGAGCRVFGV
jgi:hypothetical protein